MKALSRLSSTTLAYRKLFGRPAQRFKLPIGGTALCGGKSRTCSACTRCVFAGGLVALACQSADSPWLLENLERPENLEQLADCLRCPVQIICRHSCHRMRVLQSKATTVLLLTSAIPAGIHSCCDSHLYKAAEQRARQLGCCMLPCKSLGNRPHTTSILQLDARRQAAHAWAHVWHGHRA